MRQVLGLKADPTSESKLLASIINGKELRVGDWKNMGAGGSVQIRDLGLWGQGWPGAKSGHSGLQGESGVPGMRAKVGQALGGRLRVGYV